jgi:hypothetical protein
MLKSLPVPPPPPPPPPPVPIVIGTAVTGKGADMIFTPYPPKDEPDPYFPAGRPQAIKSAPGAVPKADAVAPVAV